jgi:hypothetical protein
MTGAQQKFLGAPRGNLPPPPCPPPPSRRRWREILAYND